MTSLAERFDRLFPGVGLRATGLSLLAAACMLAYYRLSRTRMMWDPAVDLLAQLPGFGAEGMAQSLYAHLVAVVFLLIVPAATLRFGLSMGAREQGFGLRGTRREWLIVVGLWLGFLPLIAVASSGSAFQGTYPKVAAVGGSALLYVVYELAYLLKWTAWEYFFRGFMLFGFERDFGPRSVLVSTIPFALLHLFKPIPEMAGSLVAGLLLCWIAKQNRSIWPGVFLHAIVAASMDLLASDFWRGA